MTDVTNRTIAALLFVAMAVTVFSTAITLNKLGSVSEFGLTGFATAPNATARLNISQLTSIKFTTDLIDWSNGTVNTSAGNTLCSLTTNGYSTPGYVGCIGFADPIPADFVLENDGNVNVNVTVELTSPSITWIGGNPGQARTYIEVKTHADNGMDTPCLGDAYLNASGQTELSTTPQVACPEFFFNDDFDLLNFSLRVTIPSDSAPGLKTVDIIASATPV
jgi:hypothetical protein